MSGTCERCEGQGWIWKMTETDHRYSDTGEPVRFSGKAPSIVGKMVDCPECSGSGKAESH